MRGQRPALASLLAWVAMLAMLLGTVPLLSQPTDAGPAALLQLPLEERGGGETGQQEPAPAKLRRATLSANAAQATPAPSASPCVLTPCWTILAALAVDPHRDSRDWRPASARPPRADAPGRRQQRGQAPPLA